VCIFAHLRPIADGLVICAGLFLCNYYERLRQSSLRSRGGAHEPSRTGILIYRVVTKKRPRNLAGHPIPPDHSTSARKRNEAFAAGAHSNEQPRCDTLPLFR
jgi:hypothetical protein